MAAEAGQGREDDILPTDLQSAIDQAAAAAALFCDSGGTRALVEVLVPEFETMSEEGAQQHVWDSARAFLDALRASSRSAQNMRAVFPDAGAAAMLQHQWGPDLPFAISSLNDRRPVGADDDLVVLVAPDYQMLDTVQRIASALAPEDGIARPMVLWNPRLASGDVGIGLNVRRMRDFFLGTFTAVYHLRPLGVGAIFKCYPSPWILFLDDPAEPGRYVLLRQQGAKPTLDDIEDMYAAATGKGPEQDTEAGPGFLDSLASTLSSLTRFMRSLSR